jgi:hypothetical protein
MLMPYAKVPHDQFCFILISHNTFMAVSVADTLHNHPYYHVCHDVLSLVGDPLSGNGCGSPNHT